MSREALEPKRLREGGIVKDSQRFALAFVLFWGLAFGWFGPVLALLAASAVAGAWGWFAFLLSGPVALLLSMWILNRPPAGDSGSMYPGEEAKPERKHEWLAPGEHPNTTKWACCRNCGRVKRADGRPDSPCPGVVKVELR